MNAFGTWCFLLVEICKKGRLSNAVCVRVLGRETPLRAYEIVGVRPEQDDERGNGQQEDEVLNSPRIASAAVPNAAALAVRIFPAAAR